MHSGPSPSAGRGGDRGGRGGLSGVGGQDGRRGTDNNRQQKETPKKERAPRAPKVYIGEIKGGTGEVVGKVTKPMGPSGKKDDVKGDNNKKSASKGSRGGGSSSGGGEALRFNADEAAAAHPAWAAKRKAANEAWGNVKPSGKKLKFDD